VWPGAYTQRVRASLRFVGKCYIEAGLHFAGVDCHRPNHVTEFSKFVDVRILAGNVCMRHACILCGGNIADITTKFCFIL